MVEGKEISSIQNQKKIQKKIEKKNSKNRKNQKNQKKENRKKKKSLFIVVLDKMCVFCLYPIPDLSAICKEGQL